MDATTTDTLPSNKDTLLALSSDDNDTPMATDKKKTTIDLSDSDDDSDDQGGLTGVDNLNISARLKRLMRDTTLTSALDDDDDSDDDDDPLKDNVLFRTPAAVKTPAVQSLLRTEPSPRVDKSNNDDSSDDEGNDMAYQRLPAAVSSPTANRHTPLQRRPLNFFAGDSESSSSSSSEDEQQQKTQRRRQQQPKKTRQKKKTSSSTPPATAIVSDDDNEEEQEEEEDGKKRKRPPKRAMSKRAERLMHQENQRLTRTTVAKLQPRTDKLSFNHVMEKFKQQRLLSSSPPPDKSPNTMIREKVKALNDDSDSDLEIVHPQAVKELDVASPDRPRLPFEQFQSSPSPLRNRPMTHRDLNKRLQDMMAKEMLERRRQMEEKARATGTFKTTEEIVRHQLALEKQAQQIGMQVNEHFIRESGRKSRPSNDDDKVPDEEDEDVFEELFLSGEEEEEEDDEEEEIGDEEDVHMEENEEENDDKENEATTNPPEAIPKDDDDDQPIRKRKRNNVLFSDEEEESDTASEKQVDQPMQDTTMETAAAPPIKQQRKEKSEYLDAEAQESEDEYYGAGGPDADEDEDDARLDEYEKDGMLVDKTDEHVDEATLRAALNSQLAESDKHMVERLLKDIMSGDLRRRRAAREAGLMLDDYDIYDDPEDNDLIALRRAANERRKRLLDQSGDPIQALARDPKTAAFAKALQSMPEDPQGLDLSDHEQGDDMMQGSDGDDDDDDDDDDLDPRSNLSLVIPEDEEEQEDEAPDNRHMMTLDDSDEEQGIAVVERQERPVITRDQRMRDQQRQRLKRLLAESGGNLGAPAENSARVGLTAKSQPTERKVARFMELPKAALDENPLQKREPRLLGMLKPSNKR